MVICLQFFEKPIIVTTGTLQHLVHPYSCVCLIAVCIIECLGIHQIDICETHKRYRHSVLLVAVLHFICIAEPELSSTHLHSGHREIGLGFAVIKRMDDLLRRTVLAGHCHHSLRRVGIIVRISVHLDLRLSVVHTPRYVVVTTRILRAVHIESARSRHETASIDCRRARIIGRGRQVEAVRPVTFGTGKRLFGQQKAFLILLSLCRLAEKIGVISYEPVGRMLHNVRASLL